MVKIALAAWEDSSSDSEDFDEPNDASMVVVHDETNIFNEMFTFMAQSDDEDAEDKVTLLDIKQNLNTFSLKRLRKLANVMIDSVIELTSERVSMNTVFEILNENRDKIGEKIALIEGKIIVLESKKQELKEQLYLMTEKFGKTQSKVY